MGTQNLVFHYIQSCVSGRLGPSDCGPIWQLAVIAVFLLVAVIMLAALRFRSRTQTEEA